MNGHNNTEQAILEAAESLFFEKGYKLATTTAIAARAGVNIPPERQSVKRDAIDHTRSPAITIPLQGPSDPPKAGARGGLTFPVHSTHVMQPFDVGTRSKGRWSEPLFSFVPPLS